MIGLLSLSLLLLTPVDGPLPQHLVEQRLNDFTHGRQQSLTVDGHGERLVAVWTGQRQEAGSSGIFGRALDAQLRPLGPERHLNADRLGTQERPAVAVGPDGAVWVAWQSHRADGTRIVLRPFDLDLEPSGDEILVHATVDAIASRPTLDVALNGHVLVSWQSFSRDGSESGVRSRLLDAHGQPVGDASILSNHPTAQLPGTAVLDDDQFLVLWTQRDGHHATVHAATLQSNDGRLLRSNALIAPDGQDAIEPSVSVGRSATGQVEVAVAWMQTPENSAARRGYDVWSQRFDHRLRPNAEAFRVSQGASRWQSGGWQSGATVQHLDAGHLTVLHNLDRHHAGGGKDVWLHRFDAADRPVGWPRLAHRANPRHQLLSAASSTRRTVTLPSGDLAVAWQGASEGDGHGVHLSAWLSEPVEPRVAEPVVVARGTGSALEPIAPVPPIRKLDFRPQPRLENLGGGVDFGFEAIEETPWSPPDPELAVGPDLLLFTSNGALTAFTKDGTQQWVDEIEGPDGFWGALGAGGLVFDPEVVWDPHAQRYIAMANEDTANLPYFLLAVSQDDYPDSADDWHKYRFEVSAFTQGSTFIDSPNLGLNKDYIFLTADFFGPDKYLLYVVDKASVLGGGMANVAADLIVGTQSMGIPVVRKDTTSALYIVESTEFGNNDTVILHAVTDPFGTFDRVEVEIDVDPYTFPIDPPQQDTTVRPELFEPRFWSVAQAGDSIWAVHHVDNARVRVRWYEFALNNWPDTMGALPTLVQSGEIDLGDGIHTFFPSIDADAQGNAAITFSRSATDEYISIWRAVRQAGMPAGTFGPAVMVQESANAQTDGRWGDYSGTQDDPASPGTFWGIHQFTNGDTGSWRTWAARYDDAAGGLFFDGFESGDVLGWSSSMP